MNSRSDGARRVGFEWTREAEPASGLGLELLLLASSCRPLMLPLPLPSPLAALLPSKPALELRSVAGGTEAPDRG